MTSPLTSVALFHLGPVPITAGVVATWAIMANGGASNSARNDLDFLNMATYHFCVLIWFYYLLVPGKVTAKSPVPLPENNLDVWNGELERLVHQ